MGVEGCTKCIKYLLFVFNFVFWLAGEIILGVELWIHHDAQTTSILRATLDGQQAPSTFYVGIYILIAVGVVMRFVGFLECYGSIQEAQCLLGTFFTCFVILFACEGAAGICCQTSNSSMIRLCTKQGTKILTKQKKQQLL